MTAFKTYTPDELTTLLAAHRKWFFGEAGGIRADLIRANLSDANLSGANLSGADLSGADLSGANLIRANLSDANLSGANLSDANLSGANLSDANLSGANLIRADLSGAATLPNGVRWDVYLRELVPALLVAGGKALADVLNPVTWDCHSWENCPMAVAFDVHKTDDVPPLYRAEARLFITLFDAKALKLEAIGQPAVASVAP